MENDYIYITQDTIELNTNINFRAIEFNYKDEIYIENLLPEDYIVAKGNGKILVIKFHKRNDNLNEIFKYVGVCNIKSVRVVSDDYKYTYLKIKNKSKTLWSNIEAKWEDVETKWEDLGDDDNNSVDGLKFSKELDIENKEVTYKKKIIKTKPKLAMRDKNLTDLNKFKELYKNKRIKNSKGRY
jgi:hypothetical protein